MTATVAAVAADFTLRWSQLPALPDAEGFASPYGGISHGALIVAGGANITDDKWATPPIKQWYDPAFVLERPDGTWKSGFKLPRVCGYGVSVSVDDRLICIGGSDSKQHFADVFSLEWKDGALQTRKLPALPVPCANGCGALMGRTIYVAGGIETPMSTEALKTFWALNMDSLEAGWQKLEPWPGPARMLAVAGVREGSFYLFSGTDLHADAEGKPAREYLRDAYRFTPGEGWKRLADLPRAAVAAPSPALASDSGLVVISGDDGMNTAFQPVKEHPGFPRNALLYAPESDTWSLLPETPLSRATVPVVTWKDRFVIPNGETRPRVRTPEVWSVQVPEQP